MYVKIEMFKGLRFNKFKNIDNWIDDSGKGGMVFLQNCRRGSVKEKCWEHLFKKLNTECVIGIFFQELQQYKTAIK